jgi:hypothetical protein
MSKINKGKMLQKFCNYLKRNQGRIIEIEIKHPKYVYEVDDDEGNKYYKALTDEIITIKLFPHDYLKKFNEERKNR